MPGKKPIFTATDIKMRLGATRMPADPLKVVFPDTRPRIPKPVRAMMVEDLTPDLMPVDGDALVEALRLARQLLEKSGVPGSALVIADNVSPAQAALLATAEVDLPVQFLSVQSLNAAVDVGLREAANSLDAPVVELTVDEEDVERVTRRAESNIRAVSATGEGARWLDAGYYLLPLLAFVALAWSRRGWLV